MSKSKKRVIVFIDNSNVFKRLEELHRVDELWPKAYNPIRLAEKLVGNRILVGVYFYCTPPPPFLMQRGKEGEKKYWIQTSYYEAVKKLPGIELKYGRLSGHKDNLKEKNLDSQLTANMITLAANNKFDTAILVANDGDYTDAVEGVKSFGKKVELVYFKGKVSMALKSICDVSRRVRRLYFEQLDFPKIDNNTKDK